MNRSFLIAIAFLMQPIWGHATESIDLEKAESSVPRMSGKQVAGTLPRAVLFVQAHERGGADDAASRTSFYVYDTGDAEAGFRKVFSGPPGEHQYCRFLTPLLDGCGIAVGKIDADKSKQGPRKMFWFDLLSGTVGKEIAQEPFSERLVDEEILFLTGASQGDRPGHYISRYNLATGVLTRYQLGFTNYRPLERLSFLAFKDGNQIIKVDLAMNQAEMLGEPPKGRLPEYITDAATGVYPAGPNCRDGIYCIRDLSLYYKPQGEDWRSVVENVNIVKTFGGSMAHLPVAYLGQGRFAVAKTTKDRTEVSEEEKEKFDGHPGLTATMLIDGRSGKILQETKPELYDNNPPLNIPEDWWLADAKPASRLQQPGHIKSLFRWNEAERAIAYGENKRLVLGREEKVEQSCDGRYLCIYAANSEDKTVRSKIDFRIVDGKTATITEPAITASGKNLSVSLAAWQVLCSATLDRETWETFRSSGFDYFLEPFGNW